jgi:hypothetical protein
MVVSEHLPDSDAALRVFETLLYTYVGVTVVFTIFVEVTVQGVYQVCQLVDSP